MTGTLTGPAWVRTVEGTDMEIGVRAFNGDAQGGYVDRVFRLQAHVYELGLSSGADGRSLVFDTYKLSTNPSPLLSTDVGGEKVATFIAPSSRSHTLDMPVPQSPVSLENGLTVFFLFKPSELVYHGGLIKVVDSSGTFLAMRHGPNNQHKYLFGGCASPTISINTEYRTAMIVDPVNGEFRLYVKGSDGTESETSNTIASMAGTAYAGVPTDLSQFVVGGWGDAGTVRGDVKRLRVFNEVLTTAEIQAL